MPQWPHGQDANLGKPGAHGPLPAAPEIVCPLALGRGLSCTLWPSLRFPCSEIEDVSTDQLHLDIWYRPLGPAGQGVWVHLVVGRVAVGGDIQGPARPQSQICPLAPPLGTTMMT